MREGRVVGAERIRSEIGASGSAAVVIDEGVEDSQILVRIFDVITESLVGESVRVVGVVGCAESVRSLGVKVDTLRIDMLHKTIIELDRLFAPVLVNEAEIEELLLEVLAVLAVLAV